MNRQVKQVLLLSTFAAACMGVGMGLSHHWVASAQEERPVTVNLAGLDRLPPIAEVADKLNPTVVAITSTSFVKTPRMADPFGGGDDFFNFFFGPGHGQGQPQPGQPGQRRQQDEERPVESGGSGVLISADGEILTNNHVIEGYRGASDNALQVKTSDGKSYKAKVLGRDKELDIALVKIEANHLPFAKLGDSDAMRIGEWVVAIGNPLGLDHTVTAGIISAKGRTVTTGISSFLQTDAAINRGNSGGPLLNLRGEVIGINTMIRADGQNIGFAVPSTMIQRALRDLRAGRAVSRGFLGLQTAELEKGFQEALGVKEGVVVGDVTSGQAAEKAGIQRLDVITAVDGRAISRPNELVETIAGHKAGDVVKLTVVRDSKSREITVTLGDRKNLGAQDEQDEEKSGPTQGESKDGKTFNSEKTYGFIVENLTLANRKAYGIAEDRKGVVVTFVAARSDAAEKGISPGSIITAVGTKGVSNLQEFNAAAAKAGGKAMLLLLQSPTGPGKATVAILPR
jgi:serine protease Do